RPAQPKGAETSVSVIETAIEGRYQIITRVASGGMGEVFRAHDAVLARDVAIKLLHPQLAGGRGFVERFRREARAAAILNHPSIVGVYDWGTTNGTYFMVMEFVQGTNLRSLLSEVGRLEPAQVVEVCLQVLSALDHAHGHGIVHRDIKPENILIATDGTVKVADFGLARAYADAHVSQAEGTVTGTVQYLAPEQIQALDVPEEDRAHTITIPRSISPRARRARRVRFVLTVLMLALLAGVGIGAAWVYAIPHYTHVPNVVGLPENQAVAHLKAAG